MGASHLTMSSRAFWKWHFPRWAQQIRPATLNMRIGRQTYSQTDIHADTPAHMGLPKKRCRRFVRWKDPFPRWHPNNTCGAPISSICHPSIQHKSLDHPQHRICEANKIEIIKLRACKIIKELCARSHQTFARHWNDLAEFYTNWLMRYNIVYKHSVFVLLVL